MIANRERALEELSRGVYDVLVIGGGIVGSRVAFDAARYGMRVALVEARDFGGATSGASARLIHGGLRYLGSGQIRLVRVALREREVLASRIAPHLVRPQPFVLSVTGARRQVAKCASGLLLYAALGGFRGPLPWFATPEEAALLVPPLRARDLASHATFFEAATNDSRLTLATVTAAVRAGAIVANHLRVAELRGNWRVTLVGREGTIVLRCRAVVNATGPWVDRIRDLEAPGCRPIARLSKGAHVVLQTNQAWRAGVAVSLEGGRHLYAVPCEGVVLLGTTDEEYRGDPARVAAEPGDVDNLLGAAREVLHAEALGAERVLSAFAGLRVLPRGDNATIRASRDHLVSAGPRGMVSVAGGKLTTHRLVALDALQCLPDAVRPRKLRLCDAPLPGASPAGVDSLGSCPERSTADHLLRQYGSDATELLGYAEEFPDALERITPQAPDIRAQAYHAVRKEWAATTDDIIYRRTTLGLRGLETREVHQTISAIIESEASAVVSRPGPKRHPVRVTNQTRSRPRASSGRSGPPSL